MTLRDLQYAIQDLIDRGAAKDTDEVAAVRWGERKVNLYAKTADGAIYIASVSPSVELTDEGAAT